jgi:hypothetical protein
MPLLETIDGKGINERRREASHLWGFLHYAVSCVKRAPFEAAFSYSYIALIDGQ